MLTDSELAWTIRRIFGSVTMPRAYSTQYIAKKIVRERGVEGTLVVKLPCSLPIATSMSGPIRRWSYLASNTEYLGWWFLLRMKRCLQGHQKALHRNYGIRGLYLGSYLGTKSSPEDFRSRVHSLGLLPTIKSLSGRPQICMRFG